MDRLATSLLLLFAGGSALGSPLVARPDWERHFTARGAAGTFVLLQPLQDRVQVWNEARARRGHLPAGTFEIAAAVVGLETGAVADEREVFAWDGKPQVLGTWEADHTLATGMRDNVAWMFQRVARRVGKPAMRDWLGRLEYGNCDMTGGIDQFWLQGGLRTTAMEQVAFLHRLAEGRLAASQRSQRIVRDSLRLERARAYALYGKAGAVASGPNAVSWWVGWVERRGRVDAVFATNLAPGTATPYADRFVVARAILCAEGVLPALP